MLAGSPPVPDDPAELEHLAATLLVTLEASGMSADVPSAFLDAIEMRGDPDAACWPRSDCWPVSRSPPGLERRRGA